MKPVEMLSFLSCQLQSDVVNWEAVEQEHDSVSRL
jgi:hypothetical protein